MIRSFADKRTQRLFEGSTGKGVAPDVAKRAGMRLRRVHATHEIEDLRAPPSHRLHKLRGDRAGRWSIAVNDQFRITLRFDGGHAYDVLFEDYH